MCHVRVVSWEMWPVVGLGLALDALFEPCDTHEEQGPFDDVGIVAQFLSNEVIELVVHGPDKRLVGFRIVPVGEVVHLVGVFPQVVQRHIVVSIEFIERRRLVVLVDGVVPDELVATVIYAPHDVASVEVRVADRIDQTLGPVEFALRAASTAFNRRSPYKRSAMYSNPEV